MKQKNIYLVAYYSAKPKDPKRTKEAGYMKDPTNFDYDESINITRDLKTRDELGAKVILNLTEQSVTKNTFNENKDFPSLLAHYQEGYPTYLNPLIAQLYPEQVNGDVDVHSKKEETGS
jgi:hypothetical protein